MNIQSDQLRAAARRAEQLPKRLLKPRVLDYIPEQKRATDERRLAARSSFLGEGGARPSPTELERIMGSNDLVDEFYFDRALLTAMPVCRVIIRSPSGHVRGYATGFMVSPRLLLTNEHVFGSADEAAPSLAEFNYRLDVAGNPEPSYRFQLRPDLFFFNDETLDFALVSVEPQSLDGAAQLSAFGYQRLIPETGKVVVKEWMTIIQHPGGAPKQFAIRENQCINDQNPDVLWYMSDTAPGSSGSPVLNDSFQVVALHHSGVARQGPDKKYILKNGQTVDSIDDVDDSLVDWIANAGIRVSRICACVAAQATEKNGHLAEFKAAREGGDVLSNAYQNPDSNQPTEMNPTRINTSQAGSGVRLTLGTLVLELSPNLNSGVAAVQTIQPARAMLADGSGLVETFKEPIVDTNYASRKGFDHKFLGIDTPLPTLTDEKLIAPLKDGSKVIPYEHFSVVLHKERKLAIFTASNVDGSAKAKRPEAGHTYTRKELTGLNDHEMEKWVLDPRVDEKFQIPDRFYTKDNGAFDKGHIVRREDVCWGTTFAQVQRANGDTFHVTNCSPQRGNFNQSGKDGIWGKLENFIGSQADKERYCLFAGPVLAADDGVFPGTDKAKIPSRFWKVVCAVANKKLQVFAFLLEQDLQDLPLEFQVTAEWKHKQVKLKDLEKTIGVLKFPKIYHNADQA
jgi:endonuclease G